MLLAINDEDIVYILDTDVVNYLRILLGFCFCSTIFEVITTDDWCVLIGLGQSWRIKHRLLVRRVCRFLQSCD